MLRAILYHTPPPCTLIDADIFVKKHLCDIPFRNFITHTKRQYFAA